MEQFFCFQIGLMNFFLVFISFHFFVLQVFSAHAPSARGPRYVSTARHIVDYCNRVIRGEIIPENEMEFENTLTDHFSAKIRRTDELAQIKELHFQVFG